MKMSVEKKTVTKKPIYEITMWVDVEEFDMWKNKFGKANTTMKYGAEVVKHIEDFKHEHS
jgi:hypothetical protein